MNTVTTSDCIFRFHIKNAGIKSVKMHVSMDLKIKLIYSPPKYYYTVVINKLFLLHISIHLHFAHLFFTHKYLLYTVEPHLFEIQGIAILVRIIGSLKYQGFELELIVNVFRIMES
jgi:hypothetical protein